MTSPSDVLRKQSIKLRSAKTKAIKEALDRLSKIIPDLIRLRTRDGRGLKGKLDPLSDSYIKQRLGELAFYTDEQDRLRVFVPNKSRVKLHPETSPNKSNLTATGQMLDAITAKRSGDVVRVSVKDTKRKREFNGRKSTLTNKEVAKYVQDNGREFFGLTKEETEILIDIATQIIEQEITDALNET